MNLIIFHWEVNNPKELSNVLSILKTIQSEFNSSQTGNKFVSLADIIVLAGCSGVEKAIKNEGILKILKQAGFKLREPGCSACLAMNDDKVPAGKYAVSTSNRNFEGRQGPGSRTLLASPLVAAAAAITGEITDPRNYIK